MDSIIHGLLHYGFSEKQAKVYLAALKLGAAPGGTIARQSGIQRATVYSILNDFIRDGIVRKLTRKGLMYFSVVDPEGLLSVLEEKTSKFKILVPTLKGLAESIGSKPQIQYLEGIEGLKQMFQDFMTTDTSHPMRAILGNMKYNNDALMIASEEYREFRNKKKMIFQRIVTSHNIDRAKEQSDDSTLNRQTCIVDNFPIDIRADISIYGPGKCAIIFFDDANYPHIILIKSKEVYDLMIGLFTYIREKEYKEIKNTSKNRKK